MTAWAHRAKMSIGCPHCSHPPLLKTSIQNQLCCMCHPHSLSANPKASAPCSLHWTVLLHACCCPAAGPQLLLLCRLLHPQQLIALPFFRCNCAVAAVPRTEACHWLVCCVNPCRHRARRAQALTTQGGCAECAARQQGRLGADVCPPAWS